MTNDMPSANDDKTILRGVAFCCHTNLYDRRERKDGECIFTEVKMIPYQS